MDLSSSVKLFVNFDTPVVNAVTNYGFVTVPTGGTVTFSGRTESDTCYNMNQDYALLCPDVALSISTKMSIGFWYLPLSKTFSYNSISNAVETMRVPVLCAGGMGLDILSGEVTHTGDVISIYEEYVDGNKCRMNIVMVDDDENEFVATTDEYDPDIWHFFWIYWDGSGTPEFNVYIDGVEVTVNVSGSVPTDIVATMVGLWINDIPTVLTPGYNVSRNVSKIDDLVILNEAETSISTIQKVINSSVEDVFAATPSVRESIDLGFVFNDPSAISVTDIIFDGSHYYASRSDGKVLQGSHTMWESRKDYSNPNEEDVIDKFSKTSSSVQIVDGWLKITDGTVRL